MENNMIEAFEMHGLNPDLLWIMDDEVFDKIDATKFKGHRNIIFVIASMGYSYRDVSLILNRYDSQKELLQSYVNQQDYNDLKQDYEDVYFKTIAKRLESEQVSSEKIELDTTLKVIDPFA